MTHPLQLDLQNPVNGSNLEGKGAQCRVQEGGLGLKAGL